MSNTLTSPNGRYELIVSDTGRIVLFDTQVEVWSSSAASPQTPADPPSTPAPLYDLATHTAAKVPPLGANGKPDYTNRSFVISKIREGYWQLQQTEPPADELAYWFGKMTTPDTFSDGKVRVGWNPYWQARLLHPGSDSADVALAGEETVIG